MNRSKPTTKTLLSRRIGARSFKRDNTRKARVTVHCGFNPYFVPVLQKFAFQCGVSTARFLEIVAVSHIQRRDPDAIEKLRARAPEVFANMHAEQFGGAQ